MEAISAKIPKSFYFYVVSRFCSRAFPVVGNLFLDKGAGEHRRHLMIFTEGPFLVEGLFLNAFEHTQAWLYSSRADQINFQRLGASFRRKNEEDIILLRFSTKVEHVRKTKTPLGRNDLFTTFLFLLGSTVRPQRKGGDATLLLLFRLFLFCLAALEFFSGGSDICLSADRLPWGSLGSEFGDPPGSPWVWRHSVRQAGPPKPVKT